MNALPEFCPEVSGNIVTFKYGSPTDASDATSNAIVSSTQIGKFYGSGFAGDTVATFAGNKGDVLKFFVESEDCVLVEVASGVDFAP